MIIILSLRYTRLGMLKYKITIKKVSPQLVENIKYKFNTKSYT